MKYVLVFAIVLLSVTSLVSAATCGDNICEGRPRQGNWTAGLENWDNCPQDCGKQTNLRNLAETYSTLAQTYSKLDSILLANPNYASKEIIGFSLQYKPIYLYKFGNGSTVFMVDSRIHGMEDCGGESVIKYIDWILTNNSAASKYIRANTTILFIPALNPDTLKRQNARTFYSTSSGVINVTYGVDLNRNNPTNFSVLSRGSNNPTNNTEYKGLVGASEPEIQTLQFALRKYKPTNYINTHCGGGPYLSTHRNQTYERSMTNKILNLSSGSNLYINPRTFVATSTINDSGSSTHEGNFHANSSWTLETTNWNAIPKTLDGYHNYTFSQVLPVFIAMSVPINYYPVFPRWYDNMTLRNVTIIGDKVVFNASGSIGYGNVTQKSNNSLLVDVKFKTYNLGQQYLLRADNLFMIQIYPNITAGHVAQGGIFVGSAWRPLVQTNVSLLNNTEYNLTYNIKNGRAWLVLNGRVVGNNSVPYNMNIVNKTRSANW